MEPLAELLPLLIPIAPGEPPNESPPLIEKSKPARMFPNLTPARYSDRPCGCDGSGWYLLEVEPLDPDFGVLKRCSCGAAGRAATANRIAALRDELAGLSHCTFEAFDQARPLPPLTIDGAELGEAAQRTQLARAFRAARLYSTDPAGWLYLYGPPGAGKSHLAAAIGLAVAESGRAVVYRSVPGLLDDLRPGSPDPDRAMALALGADLLILDDLGAERLSPWAIERLFRIANERASKPTIYTSNLDLDQIEPLIDIRIADRLALAVQVWMPISSYRRLRR